MDDTGRARMADFGLLKIVSDPTNALSSSSHTQGGTVRWMSPELIYPEHFGFEKSRLTKSSDCYALAMVIYETISGKVPFHGCTDLIVSLKVVGGERPRRRVKFKESLWKMLERCWAPHPNERPSIGDVLHCLETVSTSRGLPAQRGPRLRKATAMSWWRMIILLFILTPVAIYCQILYSSVYLRL